MAVSASSTNGMGALSRLDRVVHIAVWAGSTSGMLALSRSVRVAWGGRDRRH